MLVYVVDGVKFDGYRDGALLDAKGPGYAQFVTDASQGEFHPWWKGKSALIDEAQRQIGVAGTTPIEWDVAEPQAADAIKVLLQKHGLQAVKVLLKLFILKAT